MYVCMYVVWGMVLVHTYICAMCVWLMCMGMGGIMGYVWGLMAGSWPAKLCVICAISNLRHIYL